MLTPELYERMGREAERLARVVNDWTTCATCNNSEPLHRGPRIEFVEDYDAFIEVYCGDCGVTADRGIIYARALYDKLPQKSLSRRVLHYWWAARNVAARSSR